LLASLLAAPFSGTLIAGTLAFSPRRIMHAMVFG
jgi:uncharacterized membrane protein